MMLPSGAPLDRTKNVKDYDFKPHDTIIFVQQTLGVSGDGFRPSPGLEVTRDPCCALGDDNPNELRAKMPCGCPISKFDSDDKSKDTPSDSYSPIPIGLRPVFDSSYLSS